MPEIEHKQKPGTNKSGWSPCCVSREKKPKQDYVQNEEYIKKENSYDTLMVTSPEDPPHVEDLPQDLSEGSCITIEGYLKPNCNRLAVNLCCDSKLNCDIALHINPRLSQRYIVRNSRVNGVWGTEETTSLTKFNIERNSNFTLDIVVTSNEFLVASNKKHACAYVHRIPVEKIKVILIEGPVKVFKIGHKKVESYPDVVDTFPVPFSTESESTSVHRNWSVPLTSHLPEGFQQGWQLEIYGRVKILPFSFFINLQEGSQHWPHPTVHLHLNPRFNAAMGRHFLVRNAWINGEWGPEERSTGFYFAPGYHFSVVIRKGDDEFSVWIDGQLAGEFQFRANVDALDTIHIQGDVFIREIYMNKKADDKYFMKYKDDDYINSL